MIRFMTALVGAAILAPAAAQDHTPPKPAKDHVVLTSLIEVDGKWTPFLTVQHKRRK